MGCRDLVGVGRKLKSGLFQEWVHGGQRGGAGVEGATNGLRTKGLHVTREALPPAALGLYHGLSFASVMVVR